jgi:CheY-like chemotaxis protein
LKELPIVMLTSLHEKRQVPYRFAPDENYLPVDVFLDKPIEPEALVDTINELLGERREEPKHPL